MLTIKAPKQYINEFGIRRVAGKYLAAYGKRIVFLTGLQAEKSVWQEVKESLDAYSIEALVLHHTGQPTKEKVAAHAKTVQQWNADLVVSIGGGKVCDLAKAIGDEAALPTAAIPTVAATCACWAARSILYHEDGAFDEIRWNKNSPELILADPEILLQAPKRYLASGILDTLAKWYEFSPLIENFPHNTVLEHDLLVGKYAFDLLSKHGLPVYEGKEANPEIQKQVIDAIFYLAGASGSFAGEQAFRGFAHPLYFESTVFEPANQFLHGERVAYGLLVQFLLQKKSLSEIESYVEILRSYDMDFTLASWGIEGNDIDFLVEQIYDKWPAVRALSFVQDKAQIVQAIKCAEMLLGQKN